MRYSENRHFLVQGMDIREGKIAVERRGRERREDRRRYALY
jgi:hypothetical protein